MSSELKVDKITPASGTNTQIGEAGDTTNLSAGTVTLPTSIITGATEKTTLVDADKFLISDSAASGAFKHVQKSNLPSGALSFISSTVLSAASSVTINNCFSSSFQNYMVIVQNLRVTSDADIFFQFAVGGTASNDTQYRYAGQGYDRNGNDRDYSGIHTAMLIAKQLDGGDGASDLFGIYYICDPNESAVNRKRVTGHTNHSYGSNSADTTTNLAGTYEKGSTAFDGLTVSTGAGTFRAGDAGDGHGLIKIYGIVDS
tara:strand:+ start:488 stop:1261 length:774 start_codon:yes stop_codon:yes gene_type:complete